MAVSGELTVAVSGELTVAVSGGGSVSGERGRISLLDRAVHWARGAVGCNSLTDMLSAALTLAETNDQEQRDETGGQGNPLPAGRGAGGGAAAGTEIPQFAASFSPDGKRIAFVSNRHGAGGELYVVNADGTGERRLTNTPESEGMPSWSPDGRKLLYRTGSGRNPEMHTIDVETGAVETLDSSAGTPLTRNAAGALVLSKGSWPQATLVLRKPDGSDVTISPAEAIGFWPVWSNSGAQLAFVHLKPNQADPRNSAMGIAVVNADGSGFRKVTPDSIRAETPAWFPDGKRIAFQSAVSGNYDLWIVNIDGTGLRRLTTGPQLEETPHVSPDGRTIVFQSERDGVVDLWLMDANGSNIRKLLR